MDDSIEKNLFIRKKPKRSTYHTTQTCILYSLLLLKKSSALILLDPKEVASLNTYNTGREEKLSTIGDESLKFGAEAKGLKTVPSNLGTTIHHNSLNNITKLVGSNPYHELQSEISTIGVGVPNSNQSSINHNSIGYSNNILGNGLFSNPNSILNMNMSTSTALNSNASQNFLPPLLRSILEFLPQLNFLNMFGSEYSLRNTFYSFLFQCMSSVKSHRLDQKSSSGNLTKYNSQLNQQIESGQSGFVRCCILLSASPEQKRLRSIIVDFLRTGQFEYGGVRYHLKGWTIYVITDSPKVLQELNCTEKNSIMCSINWSEKSEKKISNENNEITISEIKLNERIEENLDDTYQFGAPNTISTPTHNHLIQPLTPSSGQIISTLLNPKSLFSPSSIFSNKSNVEPQSHQDRFRISQNLQDTRQSTNFGTSFINKRDSLTPTKELTNMYARQRYTIGPNLGNLTQQLFKNQVNNIYSTNMDIFIEALQREKNHSMIMKPKSIDKFNYSFENIFTLVDSITMSNCMKQFTRDVIVAVRACPFRQEQIFPIATEHLMIAAKCFALFCGYSYVLPTHIATIAPYILGHRFSLKKGFTKETSFSIVKKICITIPRP